MTDMTPAEAAEILTRVTRALSVCVSDWEETAADLEDARDTIRELTEELDELKTRHDTLVQELDLAEDKDAQALRLASLRQDMANLEDENQRLEQLLDEAEPQRVITDTLVLDALPPLTVIRDNLGGIFERSGAWWLPGDDEPGQPIVPVTVLWTPEVKS